MQTVASSRAHRSPAYARLERLLAEGEAVILDGGNATELEREHAGELKNADRGLWGTAALFQAPHAVLDVHRRYVAAGCDVVTANTWAILAAAELEAADPLRRGAMTSWLDVARLGIRLAREAVAGSGRAECAVAFSVNGDIDSDDRLGTLRVLARVLEQEPPDLILMETMSLIRDGLTFPAIEIALGTHLPVWLSFRRCRHGVCGVYGQHWGGPEGDLFGRAARRFEELGVSALLINCLPPDHVEAMLPWLRDFTDLPLGVYPNLGYFSDSGWRFDERVGPEEFAALALRWREQGAQIVGGCCGTTPAHIDAARTRLSGTSAGRPANLTALAEQTQDRAAPSGTAPPWLGENGQQVYPLPLPELAFDPAVFVPTVGSLLMWRFLLEGGIGAGGRCLDVGCGSGLLSVQLALNGARHVHAIDVQREAVANTLANAFRNGVSERVTGAEVDLYMLEPRDRYDVVVASLYQMPVDPFEEPSGHRPLDYWGRNLIDHLLGLLPALLREGGRAYVMQLSILSRLQTAALLAQAGLQARVADVGFFPLSRAFAQNRAQIARVEELSDAFHLTLGEDEVMVAYLLEITRVTAPDGAGERARAQAPA